MSAQRTVPAWRAPRGAVKAIAFVVLASAAVTAAYFAGKRAGAVQELIAAAPSEARGVALVKKEPCERGWCETLWIGDTRENAVRVASLVPGSEHCEEIAWAKDGYRVGFVINGYQLRIFDAPARKPVNQVNLIEPDGTPTSHFVRGITFSQNGASVTFDECPRGRSGCKSGLAAIR
jgi:hypothetical protein